jgi:ATP-binding cassette subfamily F protein uup
VVGLDGEGKAELFADYSQWQAWVDKKSSGKVKPAAAAAPKEFASAAAKSGKKLSYMENREWEGMEGRIAQAERDLAHWRGQLEEQDVLRDPKRLAECYRQMEKTQGELDSLYARWVELEEKIG